MNKIAIDKIFMPLNSFWEGLDKGKKIRFLTITTLIIIAISVCTFILSRKEYTILYNNMDSEEAGEVLEKLKEMNVDVKVQGAGTILVPKEVQDSLRMQLAAEGYPKTGLNYDVFQNSTGFGTTEFEKQKYLQFQLQERLQNSIKTLDIIEDAIVTLNIPDNSSFVLKEDKQNATASVIIKLKGKNSLSGEQVKGIAGLVAKSVPGLEEDQVLIIDSKGNGLKVSSNTEADIAGTQLELEQSTSDKLQKQVLSLLEPVFGVGKVSAGVSVKLDFDKQTTESVKYEPVGINDGGIPISSSIQSEIAKNNGFTGNVGLDPNGGAPQYVGNDANGDQYEKKNETINYEVNQTKDILQKAEGQIKDITISVIYDVGSKSFPAGTDQKVVDIVAGAIGVAKQNVTVQGISFDGVKSIDKIFSDAQLADAQMKKQTFLRNSIIYGIIGFILLFILIFVIRSLTKKKEADIKNAIEASSGFSATIKEEDMDASLNNTSKREFIGKKVEKNPELVAQLLRNWLNEEVR